MTEFTHLGDRFKLARVQLRNKAAVNVELSMWDSSYWKVIGFIDVAVPTFYVCLDDEYLDLLERLWAFTWTLIEEQVKGKKVIVKWLYDDEKPEKVDEKEALVKALLM